MMYASIFSQEKRRKTIFLKPYQLFIVLVLNFQSLITSNFVCLSGIVQFFSIGGDLIYVVHLQNNGVILMLINLLHIKK